jgi:hypothetical protein
VGARRLRYDSIQLASIIEAISRGRAVDGFVLTSMAARSIAASGGTNASFLDITSYVLPVAGVRASTSRLTPPVMATRANPVRRR